MKINEIDLIQVKNYLRVEHDLDDTLIQAMMDGAEEYIKSYTGLDLEIYQHDTLSIPYLMLVADMYEDRTATVNNSPDYVREALKMFLGVHDYNLIAREVEDGSGTT